MEGRWGFSWGGTSKGGAVAVEGASQKKRDWEAGEGRGQGPSRGRSR